MRERNDPVPSRSPCEPARVAAPSLGAALLSVLAVAAPACVAAGPELAAAKTPAELTISDFFRDPMLDQPQLSPDGQDIAAIHSKDGVQYLVLQPIDSDKFHPLAKAPDPDFRFQRVRWANDRTLLVSAQMRSPWSVGMRARETRLYAIERDGQQLRYLAEKWPDAQYMQYQDEIVSMLPEDAEHVLIQYPDPDAPWWDVGKVSVINGSLTPDYAKQSRVRDWHADSAGIVRAGTGSTSRYDTNQHLYARAGAQEDFEEITAFDEGDATYDFAGFSEDPDVIYVLSDHELGRAAVYRYSIGAQRVLGLLYAHPWADVVALRYTSGTDHVVAVTYATDDWESHWVDEAARQRQERIDAVAPGMLNDIVGSNRDGQLDLVRSSGDTLAPVYWLYDWTERKVHPLFVVYPALAQAQLASMEAISFQARDRLTIHGYLTLPIGRPAQHLPTIVLLHGALRARDVRGWDPEVQLFANRGFAVLQVNFRGSTGYGTAFLARGDEQWGRAMEHDITDAVKWLIARGTADPDRIGIYGSGYGGYAAMMGLVREPSLYRCGASYAGVMDLPGLVHDNAWYSDGRRMNRLAFGDAAKDRKQLRAVSPIGNVVSVRVPVLLAHGEDDDRVHVHQTENMARALKEAGKEVEVMIFPHEIHGFKEERNRIDFYEHLAAFFERNLAPRTAP